MKNLSLTSSKNIKTYMYINTVVVAVACGSFGYRANSSGYRAMMTPQGVKKRPWNLMSVCEK
jgi:hypothetical protein